MNPARKAAIDAKGATLEQVLARFLERDEEHHAAWQTVTTTQRDHGRLIEAMQVELQRMARAFEAQSGINERQIRLAETTATHGETFSRAFGEMKEMRIEFTSSLREFSGTFHGWKERHENENSVVAKSVSGYNGALRFGSVVLALVLVLVGAVATTWRSQLMTDMDRLSADSERRKLAVDIKLESLSQQVQEVRMNRQRDLEAKDAKP